MGYLPDENFEGVRESESPFRLMSISRTGSYWILNNGKMYMDTKTNDQGKAKMMLVSVRDQAEQERMERNRTADWDIK